MIAGLPVDNLLARNQGPVEVVLMLSAVVPVGILGAVGWFFWRHRHDD